MTTEEIKLSDSKNIILIDSSLSEYPGWILAYNPAGVDTLSGVHKYLAEWMIRFVGILRRQITIYQMLTLIKSELDIYYLANATDKKECLKMEIYNDRKFDREPRVIFSIPDREYVNQYGKGFRKSPIYLYSPSPVNYRHEITRCDDFEDMINPVERLISYVKEYNNGKIKAYEKLVV